MHICVRQENKPRGSAEKLSKDMFQRKTIPCFSFLWLFSIGAFCSFAQTSGPTSATSPRHSFGPVTDYNVALPTSGEVLRFRRGERYNIANPSLSELGENSEPTVLELPETHFARDPAL